MLIVSQHMIRETELEAPEAYRGKVRLYSIRYASNDCEVEGYAAVPAQFESHIPALIFNRGGNREYGALKPSVICRLAAAGFAAFGSQYRGNCGGTGREEFGGSDVNDITNLKQFNELMRISARAEPCETVSGSNRPKGTLNRIWKVLQGSGFEFAQKSLHLRPEFFNGIQVRTIRRKKKVSNAGTLQQLRYRFGMV